MESGSHHLIKFFRRHAGAALARRRVLRQVPNLIIGCLKHMVTQSSMFIGQLLRLTIDASAGNMKMVETSFLHRRARFCHPTTRVLSRHRRILGQRSRLPDDLLHSTMMVVLQDLYQRIGLPWARRQMPRRAQLFVVVRIFPSLDSNSKTEPGFFRPTIVSFPPRLGGPRR